MRLSEVLDSTYPYSRRRRQVTFTSANKKQIIVDFDDGLNNDGSLVHVSFARVGDNIYGVTGDGDAFKILATVIKGTCEWLKAHHPAAFWFTADEPSRQKLYDRLATKLDGFDGYKRVTTGKRFQDLDNHMRVGDEFKGKVFYFEDPKAI